MSLLYTPSVDEVAAAAAGASGDATQLRLELQQLTRALADATLAKEASARELAVPPHPPPHPRTKWTRRVPHPVLIGHAASLTVSMQVEQGRFRRELARLAQHGASAADGVDPPPPPY